MKKNFVQVVLKQAPVANQRQKFVFDFVFKQQLQVDYELGNEEFKSEGLVQIFYGQKPKNEAPAIYIPDSGLLHKTDLSADNLLHFNPFENGQTWNFDVFSTIFFCISRLEEYLPFEADQHGRFDIQHAKIPGKTAFVDVLIEQLRLQINQTAGFEICSKPNYKYQLTLDIDQVFAYRSKSFGRTFKGGARQLLHGQFLDFLHRKFAVLGLQPDPFDIYQWLAEFCSTNHIRPILFIHAGLPGTFDKQVNLKASAAKKAIRFMATFADIGLHPSYAAAHNPQLIGEEKSRLQEIVKAEITTCRFHYLKIRLPDSYEFLIEAGFKDDYSMGYASQPGYRAGTSHTFPFFNINKNEVRPLTIHPFQVMDTTFIRYMLLSPEESVGYIETMAAEAKELGGVFTLLAHNEMKAGINEWKGWASTYEKFLKAGLLA